MVQNSNKNLKKMGGPWGGPGGGPGEGPRGGIQAVMVEQIISKKLVFEKNRRKGSRGLGAHFPHPYPGVTPPVSAGRVRRVRTFSEKKFEKKFNLAKKMAKQIFFQNRFPYCILIVWDLH